jgi:hypothetical protein
VTPGGNPFRPVIVVESQADLSALMSVGLLDAGYSIAAGAEIDADLVDAVREGRPVCVWVAPHDRAREIAARLAGLGLPDENDLRIAEPGLPSPAALVAEHDGDDVAAFCTVLESLTEHFFVWSLSLDEREAIRTLRGAVGL